MEQFALYSGATAALGAFGGLMLVQLLVADVISIYRKHPPGTPPADDHSDLHFRSVRAHANSVETASVFLLAMAFSVLRSADPGTVALWAWIFVGGRGAHMLTYWLDLRIVRSIAFSVASLALVALFVVGI